MKGNFVIIIRDIVFSAIDIQIGFFYRAVKNTLRCIK